MGRDSNQGRLTKAEIHRDLKRQVGELMTKLNSIYLHVDDKDLRRKMQKAAAEPLIDDMYYRSPSKGLADSIEIFEPPRGKNTFVGPNYKKGGELAYIFEYGTVDRYKKTGQQTGMMDKKPFIRPAYNAARLAVLTILGREIEKEIGRRVAYLRGQNIGK